MRALSHPDAYPISFVTLRRLREVRPIVAAFLKYLTGARATTSFRQRGMLLVKEAWPSGAESAGRPGAVMKGSAVRKRTQYTERTARHSCFSSKAAVGASSSSQVLRGYGSGLWELLSSGA